MQSKGVSIRDRTILWALRSQLAHGDDDAAFKLLLALSDASEGIITNYNASVKLKGAQNRQGVTCFLDSTLFSMFSHLDSFEAMLYNSFPDLPRNRLSFLLRLWVNLLRSGQLITVDITRIIQEAIAACGWTDAAKLHQQDASEAFTFITGKLELPLLTLKMDIFHTGKEDTADDHKFINERLLDVAIPEDPTGQRTDITLEDCLESYFNNRIEVRRYLERRSTLNSMKSSVDTKAKGSSIHVETIEVDPDSSPSTPTTQFPPLRPANKSRSQSIIQERYFPARGESGYSVTQVDTKESGKSRAGSVRKEVMMPAWQFFSLIPWYTDHAPSNDAQIAAHFSSKRPVLGLCLKRYAMHNGKPIRLNTFVDIPIEIGLPHFIQDDHISDDSAPFGNFKLSLQSVVCHRGNSVSSGHYIALVRGTNTSQNGFNAESNQWMRFDDLAQERITLIDIDKALKEETPYLLFYQIMPVVGDPGHIITSEGAPTSSLDEETASRGGVSTVSLPLSNLSTTNFVSGRPSFEITGPEDSRGRSPTEGRRPSAISFSEPAIAVSKGSSRNPSPGKSNHSRSGSDTLSRTNSRTADGIGRTLSMLRKKSREVSGGNHSDVVAPAVQVREVSDFSSVHHEPQTKPNTLAVSHHGQGAHKREKSKNRLSKIGGKERDRHHPDRECIVM
jgi:Ubiquitin carboxyl-terminal hydrolase